MNCFFDTHREGFYFRHVLKTYSNETCVRHFSLYDGAKYAAFYDWKYDNGYVMIDLKVGDEVVAKCETDSVNEAMKIVNMFFYKNILPY